MRAPFSAVAPVAPRLSPLNRFLAAVSVSMVGDWLTTVAVVVALYTEAGRQGPAAYLVVRVGPRLLGSVIGGLVDRFDPARALAALSGGQTVVALLLSASLAQGQVAAALVCVAVSQVLGAAQRPAHVALIPRLTSDADLPRANGLYMGAWSSSLMVGPALAGPLLLLVSPAALVALDALSFAVCAAVAMTLRPAPSPGGAASDRPRPGRAQLLAATWADRTLRVLTLAYLASGLMMTAASAAFADAAAHQLGGASAAAWLYAVAGLGSVVGSGVAVYLRPSAGVRSWVPLAAGAAVEWAALAAFGVLPGAVAGLLALAVCGAASSVWEAWGATQAQRRAAVGSVAGTVSIAVGATYAGMLAGALLALATLPGLGWRGTIIVAAVLGAPVVLVGLLLPASPVDVDDDRRRETSEEMLLRPLQDLPGGL